MKKDYAMYVIHLCCLYFEKVLFFIDVWMYVSTASLQCGPLEDSIAHLF